MWTNDEYWIHARNTWERYNDQDSWFKGWGTGQGDLVILAALKIYRCVSNCDLFPLLGDYKIRSDRTLLQNFGLASGSGVSTADDQKLIDEVDAIRKKLGPQYSPKPAAGTGSILNDIKWTPLLNDSFILGGVHRGQEFHMALQGAESFIEDARKAAFAGAQKKVPLAEEVYKEAWKRYLRATPDVLWNGKEQVPRVFARELMGLKTFGYAPEFNFGGLGFYGTSHGTSADFAQYLKALDAAGFAKKDTKQQILSAVSEFLFQDAKVLA